MEKLCSLNLIFVFMYLLFNVHAESNMLFSATENQTRTEQNQSIYKTEASSGTICYECYDFNMMAVCHCTDKKLWTLKENNECPTLTSFNGTKAWAMLGKKCPSDFQPVLAIGFTFIGVIIIGIFVFIYKTLQVKGHTECLNNAKKKREVKKHSELIKKLEKPKSIQEQTIITMDTTETSFEKGTMKPGTKPRAGTLLRVSMIPDEKASTGEIFFQTFILDSHSTT